jgi:hypothetical protein
MKKTDLELLHILKKELGAKNNQELLNRLELLCNTLRKTVCRAVYLTDTRVRLKRGEERFIDAIPEADYLK